MKPVILETRYMRTGIHAMTIGWQHCHLPPVLRTWALSYSLTPCLMLCSIICWTAPFLHSWPSSASSVGLHMSTDSQLYACQGLSIYLSQTLYHISLPCLPTYLGINSSCCLPLTPPSPDVSALRSEVSKLLKWKEETKFIFRRVCGGLEISGLLKAEVIEGHILMVKQSTGCPISF